jgi:hypothetical protein
MVTGQQLLVRRTPGIVTVNLTGALERLSSLARVENEAARDARMLAQLRLELGLVEVKE